MKKTLISSVTIAALSLCTVFTACNKDEKIANRLAGGWEGDWAMSYEDKDHTIYTAENSEVEFHPADQFETYGKGYQMDYYDEGPYYKLSYYFDWEVNNKIIYLHYPGYPEYEARIRDFKLKKESFEGKFGFKHDSQSFKLHKVWKYYKWTDYLNRYAADAITVIFWIAAEEALYCTYDYSGSYYYAKPRNAQEAPKGDIILPNGVVAKPMSEEDRPLRIFSQLMED